MQSCYRQRISRFGVANGRGRGTRDLKPRRIAPVFSRRRRAHRAGQALKVTRARPEVCRSTTFRQGSEQVTGPAGRRQAACSYRMWAWRAVDHPQAVSSRKAPAMSDEQVPGGFGRVWVRAPCGTAGSLWDRRLSGLFVKAGLTLGSVLDDLLALKIVTGVIGGAIRGQP